MYIKSITMDGFKSYGQRTIVEGFDPFFNAITGLNGSGKSNILDGICFLLGISNLSQVRAANLQELVYKNGQTGITKATVSITFDNTDASQSPIGYEHHKEITVTRQIVIGGQNKYLINGTMATNSRVKDLFQSVQLNVNNPHFLIMQGRITKVLNMKPQEILSMIEEASGTKMYESKKLVAQKTIEAKEAKLREMKTLLNEDITPTLTRLKEERAAYLEFQKVERELEHLTKLDIAYDYFNAEEVSRKSDENLSDAAETLNALHTNSDRIAEEIKDVRSKLTEQVNKRESERKGVLCGLEAELSNCERNEVKINSNLRNVQNCLSDEENKLRMLLQQKNNEASSIAEKHSQLQVINSELNEIKTVNDKDLEEVTNSENRLQAVLAGLSCDEDGVKETLVQQLMDAKMEITKSETETKQGEMKMKHWKEELKKKSQELKKTEKDHEKNLTFLKPLEVDIQRIESEVNNYGDMEGKYKETDAHFSNLKNEIADLNERKDAFLARFQQLDFQYDDPVPRFDRSKVKGFVCEAISVKDPEMATALEVVAGGKLYNVIVDNEDTGRLILNRGNLRKRHTMIPLNKIRGQSISPDILRRAQEIVGKDNVWTALSLVKYDSTLQPAMEFVFGSCLVCRDIKLAKKVAFHPEIRKRTVTIEGDVFDPSGTLTGGSRRPGEPFLLTLAAMITVKADLKAKKAKLELVSKDLMEAKQQLRILNELKRSLEMKQQEAKLIGESIAQTVHHKLLEDVEAIKQYLVNEEKRIAECKDAIESKSVKVKELETKMKNSDEIRKKQINDAELNVNKCKNRAALSSERLSKKSQELHMLTLEMQELENCVESNDKQLQSIEVAIDDYKKCLEQMSIEASEAKETVEAARQRVLAQNSMLKLIDREIQELQRSENGLAKSADKNKLEMKTIQISINKMKTTAEEATHQIRDLLARYDWITEEKIYFGRVNTPYDFSAVDFNEAQTQIAKLKERKEELSRNVNMRAMSLLDRTEEQYNELMKKKLIIKKDKDTIAAVIKELDEKKKEALQSAWIKVNADFGSIFSTILPGTQAKLIPLEGKTVLDGLEVKVAFGDTWKQSLNELSGGQRSLVALSLILSLLLFRPAPIYILDEVDAALDLSHTQNIGSMLKAHFKHSQFIIVSLKDGMFNNANILFKTKFVDGMSTVTRHQQTRHAN